ncbi:hypothetical protein [Maribacter sp. 2307ULW6-5]|uniref:hypothetical protein n=1 Tax=Maribacter sp. 2307ULW6-5 TaxID=3386275 RepID=UPI0039BD17D9
MQESRHKKQKRDWKRNSARDMTKLSFTLKLKAFLSIGLWVIGSVLLFQEGNGAFIMVSTAVIILSGLFSSVRKELREKASN